MKRARLKKAWIEEGTGLRSRGRSGPGFEGNRGWRSGQPGSMMWFEDGRAELLVTRGLFQRTWIKPGSATRDHRCARPAAGPLSAPLLRRLASAPLEGRGCTTI